MQVLTVHSPFRVENLTNQQLEFNVHLFRGPQTLGAPSKGAAAISVVPNNPLAPGQQTYLPVPAIWSVMAAICSIACCVLDHGTGTGTAATPAGLDNLSICSNWQTQCAELVCHTAISIFAAADLDKMSASCHLPTPFS